MGIILALVSALGTTASQVVIKNIKSHAPTYISWVRFLTALPLIAIAVTLFSSWSIPPASFFILVCSVILPIEILVAHMRVKAIQLSDVSFITPLDAFTSVFLLPAGYFLLGEIPTYSGVLGVLVIVIGAFVVTWQKNVHILTTVRFIWDDIGARISVISSILISLSIIATKTTFTYVDPTLAAFYIVLLLTVTIPIFTFRTFRQTELKLEKKEQGYLALFSGISILSHYVGLSILASSYFISVKRISMVFSVLSGKYIFSERHFLPRLFGSFLMIGGIILIAFG